MPLHLSNRDRPSTTPFVGIDVGARRLHAVAIDSGGTVTGAAQLDAGELSQVVTWVGCAREIAIDAPDGWSTAPHADDPTLSPKFRRARCGEIGLGRSAGVWVPWTTPVDASLADPWMRTGVALFAALRGAGQRPLEVYPYGAFRVLNRGRPLLDKRTADGRRQRHRLLEAAGVGPSDLLTTHDFVDAAVAALVARDHADGRATSATCGHDGSAIWLPARPGRPLAAGVPEPARPPH